MPSISSDSRLFGVDLHLLWTEVRQAWSHLHDWPLFSWLTPAPQVVLLHGDGTQSFWRDGVGTGSPIGNVRTSFTALELPEEYVLRRVLTIPAMAERDIQRAVGLEAKAVSPFAQDDLAWGYVHQPHSSGASRVNLAMASRKQVAQYIEAQRGRLGDIHDVEVWVPNAASQPTILEGYAEGLRRAQARRGRNTGYALLGLGLMLLGCMALTPTLQLRMRALEAFEAHQAVVQRTAPLVKEREQLMQSVEKLNALSEMLAGRIEPLRVLDMLTQVLPDDTAVQNFKLQGSKVTLTGITANGSTLMQLLGEQAGLREVKAPSAATRLGGATKETFVIEFVLDPQYFGVVGTGAAARQGGATVAGRPSSTPPSPVQGASGATVALKAASEPVLSSSSASGVAPTSSSVNAASGPARPSFGGGRPAFGGGGASPAVPTPPAQGASRSAS